MNPTIKNIADYLTQWNVSVFHETKGTNTEILTIPDKKLCLFIALPHQDITANEIAEKRILLDAFREKEYEAFVIWEDQWLHKQAIVKNRLAVKLHHTTPIYARCCQIQEIDKLLAKPFFEANHLLGYLSSKKHYALIHKQQIVAVAGFGSIRKMTQTNRGFSSELIQFACLSNTHIVGGLSRLLKNYFSKHTVHDIMTYIPIEWSSGKAFEKIGFQKTTETPPLFFSLTNEKRTRKNKYHPTIHDLGNYKMIIRLLDV